jgi:hypothetical protein
MSVSPYDRWYNPKAREKMVCAGSGAVIATVATRSLHRGEPQARIASPQLRHRARSLNIAALRLRTRLPWRPFSTPTAQRYVRSQDELTKGAINYNQL